MPDPVDSTYADAAVITLCRTMGLMFRSLIKEGMNRKEALVIVVAWMSSVIRDSKE